ncbi:hypothetical protein ACFPIJ_63880 [Dactylosporangium cerinum]|uniref:Integral membrane protein n=1 Tax=Dactylosporangium cerinum TaxID=1434730 RepID=A0ABV9WKK5_9ACTN
MSSISVPSAIGHRWPTWLALAWAAISLWDAGDGLEYAFLLAVAAAGYLFVTVVDRPRATWPVLFALVGVVAVQRLLDIDPWPSLVVLAVALIAVGLFGGQLRRRGLPALQSPASLVFLAVGVAALSVPTDVGRYLVAAGLLAHAAWDAAHWRADAVVARSFAEWCGVLDLTLAVGILFVAR